MIQHPPTSQSRLPVRALSWVSPDRVATTLARHLDDSWHYVRHAAPGGMKRIDAVVVGPGGTWTVTLAEEHGRFRKRNGHWYRWNASTDSWIPWDAVAVTSARLAGHRLELLLERAALPAVVEACLVTQRAMEVSWEADQKPGVHVYNDPDKLGKRILRDEVLTAAQVDRIVALLDPRQPLPRLAPSAPQG